MRPNTALALAIGFSAAAVGLVTYETLYGLRAALATPALDDAGWEEVARYEEGTGTPYLYGPKESGEACAQPRLRLTVENHAPLPETVRVRVTYYNVTTAARAPLLDATWPLAAYESRAAEFEVPRSGYLLPEETQAPDRPWHPSDVAVTFDGEQILWACVRGRAS